MSAIIETLIVCDDLKSDICEGTYGKGDNRHLSAYKQRRHFKINGWHRSKGKDICPHCWELRKRGEK